MESWEIKSTLQSLAAHAKRMQPLIDQLDPSIWISKGATNAYSAQVRSAQSQCKAVQQTATELAEHPDKTSAALDVYFRIQSLQTTMNSLVDAVRRYQNAAMADLINGVLAENDRNREKFQNYIIDVVAQREGEFAVMDKEAQRCRDILVRQPLPPVRGSKK